MEPHAVHPESLLQLSLVRQMLDDPRIPLVPRAIDCAWRYDRSIPVSVSGFNPFEGVVTYGARSAFARWLAHPAASARLDNEGDRLVYEVLFAVHDHLHAWAAQLFDEIVPERGFRVAPIAPDTLEDHVFLLLLTEAAATVGLDYWYLATFDLNERVPIGTTHRRLTVDYREADLPEYRRFHPALEVQAPAFFTTLARFYCTGRFPGFGADDLRRSPRLLRWLEHELTYGRTQRVYARMWLRYLATGRIQDETPEDGAPVAADADWQARAIDALGQALWAKVKEDRDPGTGRAVRTCTWRAPVAGTPDFRFTNLAAVPDGAPPRGVPDEVAGFWAWQALSRVDHAACPPDLRRLLRRAARQRDLPLLAHLAAGVPRLEPAAEEPGDLLLLN